MEEFDPTMVLSVYNRGRGLVALWRRWNEGPSIDPVVEEHYREWIATTAERVIELASRSSEFAGRLAALEQDRERVILLGNYGLEAWREAVDRRRAMLGDAATAAVFSPLSSAELARIERTIRSLDPEDLDSLKQLRSVARYQADLLARYEEDPRTGSDSELRDWKGRRWRQDPAAACYEALTEAHLGGAALVASGCVAMLLPADQANTQNGRAHITPLGDAVLRFMAGI